MIDVKQFMLMNFRIERFNCEIVVINKGLMSYITIKELEIPRSALTVKQWVDANIQRIGSTDEGKQAVRLREGLLKELIEEALPLGIFCDAYFDKSEMVTVTHKVGNQNYDVVVEDSRPQKTTLKYIEITQAHEGEESHLRMLFLNKNGHANVIGKVTKSGTKHKGINIEIENEAISHSVIFCRGAEMIRAAAIRKAGNIYPEHTGLVIVCDDYIAFKDEQDKQRLSKFVETEVLKILKNFEKVFIIGWSSKLYLEFHLSN